MERAADRSLLPLLPLLPLADSKRAYDNQLPFLKRSWGYQDSTLSVFIAPIQEEGP